MVTSTISYTLNRPPSDIADYHCSYAECSKRYGKRSELLRHIRTRHLYKWICEGCEKEFTRSDNLRRHKKKRLDCKGAGMQKVVLAEGASLLHLSSHTTCK